MGMKYIIMYLLLLSMIKLQYKKKGRQSYTQNECMTMMIVGCYEKKLCRAQICARSCAHHLASSCQRLLCPLLRWWLCWHCWCCCPLCRCSRCRSCWRPLCLLHWCLLHWCPLCWCLLCWRLSRGGAVCRAGMFVVPGACHALCWRSDAVFIVLVRAGIRGCGFVTQVWRSSYWYSLWVPLDSLP